MSLPPSRSELSLPLLDAIRRRDAATTARCIRRWVHRHGVASLADFRSATVIPQEGSEAGDWLQQQLDGAAPSPLAVVFLPAEASASAEASAPPAVEDAFAALEAAFLPLAATPVSPSAPNKASLPERLEPARPEPVWTHPEPTASRIPEGTGLPGEHQLAAIRASSLPAPSPATLADLRSWLSAAPQHRRAS